ncbi:MAG: hypothetical protein KJ936_02555, partial [Proteobacteria bacterium]|nr:hypothetical protein [Pseudomonadota bacterium]MBU2226545.1 hypothetical protein [Pseudomonadota bacterium]
MKPARIVFMLIALLLLPPRHLFAGDIASQYYDLREKEIRQFAFDLFHTGEHYRAITEAKRYASFFPT